MEAWIVHIHCEHYGEDKKLYKDDEYHVWSTEKQAYKSVGKYLKERLDERFGLFCDHEELRVAVLALVEVEKVAEAIGLINRFSEATPYKTHFRNSFRVEIKIIQSKFLGSVWE
jgi:hypothetical protein